MPSNDRQEKNPKVVFCVWSGPTGELWHIVHQYSYLLHEMYTLWSIKTYQAGMNTPQLPIVYLLTYYLWWRFGAVGSDIGQINKVILRWARLVLGWVTVSGFNSWCGKFISVYNQPPRSTQPGHPFVGRHNEYQPKGGDALWLGVKADMVLFAGNTVWSISERVRGVCTLTRYTNPRLLTGWMAS